MYVRYICWDPFRFPEVVVLQWLGHRGLVHTIFHLADAPDKPADTRRVGKIEGFLIRKGMVLAPLKMAVTQQIRRVRENGRIAPPLCRKRILLWNCRFVSPRVPIPSFGEFDGVLVQNVGVSPDRRYFKIGVH